MAAGSDEPLIQGNPQPPEQSPESGEAAPANSAFPQPLPSPAPNRRLTDSGLHNNAGLRSGPNATGSNSRGVVPANRRASGPIQLPNALPRTPASGEYKSVSGIRPIASSSRTRATGSGARGTNWTCFACGKKLFMESVTEGRAELRDGNLWCSDCLITIKANASARGRIWIVVGVMTAMFACAAILFPGSALFIGALAAIVLAITGAIGFDLRGIVRLQMVLGGLLASGVCLWAVSSLETTSEHKQAAEELKKDAVEAQTLLASNQYVEAQAKYTVLDSSVRDRSGQYQSQEAKKVAVDLRAKLDEWLRSNYRVSTPQECQILSLLLTTFPENTVVGVRRFRAVRVDGGTLLISVLLHEGVWEGLPNDDPMTLARYTPEPPMRKAHALLTFAFRAFRDFTHFELEIASTNAAGDVKELGKFPIERAQAERVLRYATDLEDLMKRMKDAPTGHRAGS